jgi:GNAT superfamily N-acetyltransferase
VTDYTVFAGFSCGHPDLDDFLHNDAAKHAEQLLAVTYSLCLEGASPQIPLAFTSLLNDSAKMGNRFKRRLPKVCHYRDYPAVKIGRLGVRQEAQGQGVGRDLLDILRVLFLQDNRTGCRIMTVDAYAESAGFYRQNGFQYLSADDREQDTRAMFFDLARFRLRLE